MKIELQIDHRYTDNDNEESEYHLTGFIGGDKIDATVETYELVGEFINWRVRGVLLNSGKY